MAEISVAGLPSWGSADPSEASCRMTNNARRTHEPFERYKPRAVTRAGTWQGGSTRLKVYGLLAEGRRLTSEIMQAAEGFVREDVAPAMASEGADNGAGFVIVHPGDFGVSTSVHWWVQGSVLCQRIRRKLYNSDRPMNVTTRPVIACVWEPAIIDAEQKIWRETLMFELPDLAAYQTTSMSAASV